MFILQTEIIKKKKYGPFKVKYLFIYIFKHFKYNMLFNNFVIW